MIAAIHYLFSGYTMLIFARIMLSWRPVEWQHHRLAQFVVFYTDPYLNFFRRIIPPIGGVLDLSPILGFFVLRLAEGILLSLLR